MTSWPAFVSLRMACLCRAMCMHQLLRSPGCLPAIQRMHSTLCILCGAPAPLVQVVH